MSARTRRIRRWAVIPAVLAFVVAGTALVVPRLLEHVGTNAGASALPWGPPCSVADSGEFIGLTRAEARAATTAVLAERYGGEVPDTSGIDPAVLERLREGPPDDAGPSLSCRASLTDGLDGEEATETGLTPRAERVRREIAHFVGDERLGGYEPGGVTTGHGEDSAHYDGRAIDVFYRPVDEANRREGWLLAHWLVAHAERLHVANVIFDDRIWNVRGSQGGWWPYESPDPENEILRHLDHVHVDVQPGARE
ncbi:hypothetical protein [Nocardiopsis trehalosi]|jgi:hypothetical protein|uniref:hypothetical protein n=1 Tax=Nocardiopsis trehalosi TaxID=109329 RepID=UPI00082C065F|nr:hypothetical protein [Nocardiopsis trehalosi]